MTQSRPRRGSPTPTGAGKRIRAERERRGWTLAQLAKRMGRGTEGGTQWVSEVERGRRRPSGRALWDFARALQISRDYLATGQGSRQYVELDLPEDLEKFVDEHARRAIAALRTFLSFEPAAEARSEREALHHALDVILNRTGLGFDRPEVLSSTTSTPSAPDQ